MSGKLKDLARTGLYRTAVSGIIATLPMSLWMVAAQRLMPSGNRAPLPPEQITGRVLLRLGLPGTAHSSGWRRSLSLVSHFAYGALSGTLYLPLETLPLSPAQRGTLLGLFIWALNYLKVLPELSLYPAAQKQSFQRNLTMVTAHLIWGGALGLVNNGLLSGVRRRDSQLRG